MFRVFRGYLRLVKLNRSKSGRAPVPGKRGASKGFTLVELLIGATLSAMVMAAVFSSYIYLGRSLTRLANQQTLETEARRALGYFAQDVEQATGIDTSVTLSASRVSLTVPAGTGTSTITYYYNSGSSDTAVTINGSSVTMAANALTRCVYNGASVSSQTLLRHITALSISYYDSAGSAYANYTDYLPGIKQLSLVFSTQTGSAPNGTRTFVQQTASGRLILRNRGFLP